MKIIYIKTKNKSRNYINIIVQLFWGVFSIIFFKCILLGTSFPHGKTLCKTAESSKLRKKDTLPPATLLWALCGTILTSLWPCSLFALEVDALLPICVCTFCSCLHLLKVSSYIIVMIILLGSGYTLMSCYDSEV